MIILKLTMSCANRRDIPFAYTTYDENRLRLVLRLSWPKRHGVDLGLIEWFKHFPAHSTCFLNSISCHPHLTCNLWHAAVQFFILTQVLGCNSDPAITLFLSYFLFLKFLCSPSDIGISWHWNGYLSSSFIFNGVL